MKLDLVAPTELGSVTHRPKWLLKCWGWQTSDLDFETDITIPIFSVFQLYFRFFHGFQNFNLKSKKGNTQKCFFFKKKTSLMSLEEYFIGVLDVLRLWWIICSVVLTIKNTFIIDTVFGFDESSAVRESWASKDKIQRQAQQV